MKLPKNYLENLSASRYREYLKLLPQIKNENTKTITMLIFTFVALSILGFFAINPTISTIITLKKQVTDSEFVQQQLSNKIKNLSSLQQQYTNLSSDLPVIDSAIPTNAEVVSFIGQVKTLAKNSGILLSSLKISPVVLSANNNKKATDSSFNFSLDANGSYDNLVNFVTSLTTFNRIITIESISILKNPQSNNLILSVQGKGYFKK
ncbi:type 4a pilus biogenesis protein PilO [Candidatus Roizmanbacteria bacterium]|nr:type 4a pilus biogenesis protein PilO [Candidatus Roizmanbacteria bacterium]